MNAIRLIAVALIAAALNTHFPASASEIKSIQLDDGGAAIFIIGDIEQGDARRFRHEAGKHDDAVVFLESDGGLTAEAIEIGEAIRLKGFATTVVNDSRCNSACALIWLAGTPRSLARSARVGFHATYTEKAGSTAESGVGNAIVGRYLTLLNLPERAVIFATTAPPTGMNWLNSVNHTSAGIDVTIIDDLSLSGESSADSGTRASTRGQDSEHWSTVGFWSIMIDTSLQNGCYLLASFDNDTVFRVGMNGKDITKYYFALSNSKWRSLKPGQDHALTFQFDEEGPWDVPARVVTLGDGPVLMGTFSDVSFWAEFALAKGLYIRRNGDYVTGINLDGTKLAFDEMLRCQESQLSKVSLEDPFAK